MVEGVVDLDLDAAFDAFFAFFEVVGVFAGSGIVVVVVVIAVVVVVVVAIIVVVIAVVVDIVVVVVVVVFSLSSVSSAEMFMETKEGMNLFISVFSASSCAVDVGDVLSLRQASPSRMNTE